MIEYNGMSPGSSDTDSVWVAIAKAYSTFGSPFVPTAEDVEACERAIKGYMQPNQQRTEAVVLGVTPKIVSMNWPNNTFVTGVDSSRDVIAAIWPGDIPMKRMAVCASWLNLPIADNTSDVVVGDGSLNVCRYPDEMAAILASVKRALKVGGLLVLRCYLRPDRQENLDELFYELKTAKPPMTVDCFKFRLYVAMQRSLREGISVRNAYQQLIARNLDRANMLTKLKWPLECVEPFELWRHSDAVYSFPTLMEIRDLFRHSGFTEISISKPAYKLGNLCPTLVLVSG
jgi:SAM-dependent methyltransferase